MSISNIEEKISRALKIGKTKKKITFEEIADKSGVSLSTIKRIFKGEDNISINKIKRVIQVLEVEEIFDEVDYSVDKLETKIFAIYNARGYQTPIALTSSFLSRAISEEFQEPVLCLDLGCLQSFGGRSNLELAYYNGMGKKRG